ncbi:MAG: hypothetical protein ACI8W3_001100 [Myxococcota bacterium]
MECLDLSDDGLNVLGNGSPAIVGIDQLRDRSASALETALAFVEGSGDELARLRANVLVGVESADAGVAYLASQQQVDGSFASSGQVFPSALESVLRNWMPGDKIVGCLEAISVLGDWGRMYEPCGDLLVDYLRGVQGEDGGWGIEPSDAVENPIRVFATGFLAGSLGRTRSARPETLTAAGAYVGGFWSVDYIRKHGWPAVAAYAHYFTNVLDEESEAALPWCARELERGKLTSEYSAADILRVLFYCEAEALPGVEFDSNALLDTLLNDQHVDGSFGLPDSAAVRRVGSTLDAMLFMLRLCQSQGQG